MVKGTTTSVDLVFYKTQDELAKEVMGMVMKILVNTLKKRGVYAEFRKYYTMYSMSRIDERKTLFSFLRPREVSGVWRSAGVAYTPFGYRVLFGYTIGEQVRNAMDLVNSFTWAKTPQGHGFWSNICASVRKEVENDEGIKKKVKLIVDLGYGNL